MHHAVCGGMKMRINWLSYLTIGLGILALALQPILESQTTLQTFFDRNSSETTVVIDPGHGGEDGGATGVTGALEKGINLSISRKLQALLEFYGVNTVMTREEDESIYDDTGASIKKKKISDIKNRVKLVNKQDNPVLLSVHLNFFPQPDCRGAQVFYSKSNENSQALAEYVQDSLKCGINDGNHRLAKAAENSIYLMNHVDCPAVLTECGFLSNPDEEALLVREEYQSKLAVCIAAGYLQFAAAE